MIYQEEILDHYRCPRNQGVLKEPDVEIVETNASCGDTIKLHLQFDKNKKLKNIKFLCDGCAISKASSSMVSQLVKGKNIEQIKKLSQKDIEKLFGSPISIGRIKCATLGLKALQNGIKKYTKTMKKFTSARRDGTKKPMTKKTKKTASARKDGPKITKDINLGELMANFPKAAQALVQDYELHCVGCMAASFETLEQGLQVHGYDDKKITRIVESLQNLDR